MRVVRALQGQQRYTRPRPTRSPNRRGVYAPRCFGFVQQRDGEMDTRDLMFEKAEELGRMISQMPEYQYLQAAQREIAADREATETLNQLRELQEQLLAAVQRGEEPPQELGEKYESLQEQVQQSARYQALISSQANFDKLMEKIHRSIGQGIKKGEESRIIIPT